VGDDAAGPDYRDTEGTVHRPAGDAEGERRHRLHDDRQTVGDGTPVEGGCTGPAAGDRGRPRRVREVQAVVINDPVLQEGCRRLPLANWDRAWETLVTRAEARGEVPAGAGRSVAAEVGPAVLALRWLVTGRPLDGAVVTELVDRVVLLLLRSA
jgi:tetracycline repressor-like protein